MAIDIDIDKAVGINRGVFIFYKQVPGEDELRFLSDPHCFKLLVETSQKAFSERAFKDVSYKPESLCTFVEASNDLKVTDSVQIQFLNPGSGRWETHPVEMSAMTLPDFFGRDPRDLLLRGGSHPTTSRGETLKEISQTLNTLSLLQAPRTSFDPSATSDAALVLENELREVLHWRPRTNDTKGFLAALEQSFEETEVRGLPSFVYSPRSYTVTTDLSGEITGAQASLYARAKLAVDESLKLLDGLKPLADAFDKEEADAYLAIVRQRMRDLTDELARPAGPRVARLDELFVQLLGKGKDVTAENVGGRLGDLRDEYELKVAEDTVNTIEEEKTATDFRIIVDYLAGLHDDWREIRHFFSGDKRFLGTQLVWLERLLAAVAESSEEVRQALNSVLIGSLEQLSLVIHFSGSRKYKREPILVDDLLEWISSFASEEAPKLIEEGGRTAITTELLQTATLLRNIIFDILEINKDDQSGLPDEFFYPIVRAAFTQLHGHLATLAREARKSDLGGEVAAPRAHRDTIIEDASTQEREVASQRSF